MSLFALVFNELLMYKIMDSICEILIFILGIYSIRIVFNKWKIKRNKTTLYLLFLFLSLSFAPIAQFIDGLFYSGWGVENTFGLYDIQIGYSFILILTSIANISLLFFTFDIFIHEENKISKSKSLYLKAFKITGSIILGILGGIGGVLKLYSIQVTIIIALYFVFAMILYIFLGANAYKLARKVNSDIFKNAIKYIGHFSFTLLAVYVFFILDSFYPTYTMWGFLGWASFLIAVYLAYIGFVSPMKKIQNE